MAQGSVSLTPRLSNIHFNIILCVCLPIRFKDENYMCISYLAHACFMICFSSFLFNHEAPYCVIVTSPLSFRAYLTLLFLCPCHSKSSALCDTSCHVSSSCNAQSGGPPLV
jgi:hypothetical protein